MYNKQSTKRAVETFLVAKGVSGTALYNTGNVGNNITNLAGANKGKTVLADGQIGIFAAGDGTTAINTATAVTPTLPVDGSIYLAAGLPKDPVTGLGTNVPYPLWPRPFERSGDIQGKYNIVATYAAYAAPMFSTWIVGSTLATGGVNIIDEKEYSLQVAEFGYHNDIMYSSETTNVISASYVTPNYTALGTTNPTDHLLQNLAYEFNRNSKHLGIYNNNVFHGNANIVVIGIGKNTATAGIAANSGALIPGYVLDVVNNVNLGGKLVMTAESIASIQAAIAKAGFNAASKLIPINLATAGTTANNIDALLFLSLDRTPVYIDRIPFLKTNIKIGLTRGFNYPTVLSLQGSTAFEGTGTSKLLQDQYRKTHGQRLYNLNHTEFPVIEFPSPIVDGEKYNTYIIHHEDTNQIDLTNISASPLKTIVCVPTSMTTMNTQLTTAINSYLTSCGAPTLI